MHSAASSECGSAAKSPILTAIMDTRWLPQSRAERLIATGRFVLSIASCGAIYFDPLEPARMPTLTYTLLAAYAVYSLVAMIWSVVSPRTSERRQIVTHVIDMTFFGVVNYMTAGPTSPFFTYFVFGMVCAILRFGRRGTLATAVAALAVFMMSGARSARALDFELNRFIIRATYLVVVGSLLVYLADYQQRMHADLARIARWPRTGSLEVLDLVTQLLREASSIFGARRALLAYEYLGERHSYLGVWEEGKFRASAEPSETAEMLLDSGESTFVSSTSLRTAVDTSSLPLPAAVVSQYAIDDVVATSLKGDFIRGRLLLLDGRSPLLEDVNLARIAGGVVAGRLDHFHATEQLRRGAVAEERVRVARDLHDSVLQALTGVALQLRTIPRLMSRDPHQAEQRLEEVEQVIVSGQKDLRWFIDQLHPERHTNEQASVGLTERLVMLSQRFNKQWGLDVTNEVAPIVHLLPMSIRHEIYAIVSEAVANAAKHAEAKKVTVAVNIESSDVRIQVADDGKGFSFRGRYDLNDMIAMKRGPVTLKERVASLGGQMIVDSSENGAKLEIRVPLTAGGA